MTRGEVPAYWSYWGKADPAVGGWHLAAFHMLDVAAVATRMLQRDATLRRLLTRHLRLPEAEAVAVVALFVALHDIGKLDVRFQLKAREAAVRLDPARESARGGGVYDHGAWGFAAALRDRGALVDPLGETDLVEALLQAVTGHHGELPTRQPPMDTAGLALGRFAAGDRAARAEFCADVISLFQTRGARLPLVATERSPIVLAMLVAGLCSVADWVGSQVEHFAYRAEPADLPTYFDHALLCADRALDAVGIGGAVPSGASFGALFPGFTPRGVQTITEGLEFGRGPMLAFIEEQMGGGKTEAAQSIAERLLANGSASRLYIGLPTQATSNGMLERIVDMAPRMFSGPVHLRLAHGQARSQASFERIVERGRLATGRLAGGYGTGGGVNDEAQVVCARWFLSRKRALLADIGVGTVDQAMQAAIRVRHHFVRTFALASSVVVIDEVHAYDAYMGVILERLIEWLGALNAPVLLLSATLPAERRLRLGNAYAQGAGWEEAPSAGPARLAAYPLVTVVSERGTSEHALATPPTSVALAVELVECSDPYVAVLPGLIEDVKRGGMVAWIRNTVAEAQEASDQALALGAEPLLFHARLRPLDRRAVEAQVLSRYGRDGKRGGVLLIATQVVEQSLDLDFDRLISDLAPIDLLLQRAGRLHRHSRERPLDFPRTLFVVTPLEAEVSALRFGSSGRVYDPATLWLAHDSLRERAHIQLPGDIRMLVEDTYDSSIRARRLAAASNHEALARAEAARVKELEQREDHARAVCIPPTGFELTRLRTESDDEEEMHAMTRDGDSERVLCVLWDSEQDEASTLDDVPIEWDSLDPEGPKAYALARLLGDQIVSFPAWEWDRLEGGGRPRGDAKAWERFEQKLLTFMGRVGVGEAAVVPVRRHGAEYKGRIKREKSNHRLRYSPARGLSLERDI